MMTIVRTKAEAQGSDQAVVTALDELAREGARRMILAALEIEVEEYRQQHRDARDPRGHALVVRNGQARPRHLTVGAGTVTIAAPRVNDQRVLHGARQKFTSAILPPYVRRSGNVSAVLPLLSICMACPPGTSGRPCRCCWETTRPACRPQRSRV
ncbi:MAG: transposase [Gammaproteobacteria bacterium]